MSRTEVDEPRAGAEAARRSGPRLPRADRLALAAGLVLVATAMVVGRVLIVRGAELHTPSAPFFGHWEPHASWSTPVAVVLAVAVVWKGHAVAARLPWRGLLWLSYAYGLVWAVALAVSRGWFRGLAGRLTPKPEYLTDVPDAPPFGVLLHDFVARIPGAAPDNWTTHVAGHPPGAFLVFVGLHRLGLGGPVWAGQLCLWVGLAAVPAVAVGVKAVAGEVWARAALPFLVLFPGVVYVAVSADGMFLAVTAWGLALLAVAGRESGARHDLLALGGGLLLGLGLFLSYGFTLLVLPVLAVVAVRRRLRTPAVAALPVAGVTAAFGVSGFWWWDGYQALVPRYYAGYGGVRPYGYFVWADLAVLAALVGPATWVALRYALRGRAPLGLRALVASFLLVVLAATLSGMSKGEVERIWLPFAGWLVAACAALPAPYRRWALAGQAATALAIEHLMATHW